MDHSLLPEVVTGAVDIGQPQLPLATEGVQRYVWRGAFGEILIEVRDGSVFVNGRRVEPVAETLRKQDEDVPLP